MKIVCLLGSPRANANSSAIAERFCSTAEKLGSQVQTFILNDLNYRGCQGCMACKIKLDQCVLEDDLTEVLEAVRETDILVLASPVYYGEVSSQMKSFIDRTYSYFVPDFHTNPKPCRLEPGKKLVFVLTQGHPDESRFTDIFPRYDYFFTERYGFSETHLIRVCGVRNAGEIEDRQDAFRLAEKTAGVLCGDVPKQ
jgi:multimeric flavodoxin WrbA